LFGFNFIFLIIGFYALLLVALVNFTAISKGRASPLLYQPPSDAMEQTKKEYAATFSASVGISGELSARVKKLRWWQRIKLDWWTLLPILFALIISVFGLVKSLNPSFPDWIQQICLTLVAVLGILNYFLKSKKD
jgi:hypothetical protein